MFFLSYKLFFCHHGAKDTMVSRRNYFLYEITSHSELNSPLTTHHSPFTIHHSPLTTHHSPFTTHHSPLTTHHSPLTIHHSPLTIHHSPKSNWSRVKHSAIVDLLISHYSLLISHFSFLISPPFQIRNPLLT